MQIARPFSRTFIRYIAAKITAHIIAACIALLPFHTALAQPSSPAHQWDVFEISLKGPSDGNPFTDVTLTAHFTCGDQAIDVTGFYDGDGTYRLRFMPAATGTWTYETHSNQPALNGQRGEFVCDAAADDSHGPVRVHNTYHFAYADGTAFTPIGTTSYGWVFQPDAMEEQTLATLKASPFNKVRMCVLPIAYAKSKNQPIGYPFPKTADGKWDFSRLDVAYFQHLDRRIAQLRDLHIQADLILFNPYNVNLGLHEMTRDDDDRFVKYLAARLSAYSNVWWSLANEFDLIKGREPADWNRLGNILQHDDPYGHLRSIHFSKTMFDPSATWMTHVSVQNGNAVADFGRASLYRDAAAKPVVYDEICYEGNVAKRWGQLSGEEMTMRFWLGTIAGTYVGHGEVWKDENDARSWTSGGGKLLGASPPRIAFLKNILADVPADIEPIDRFFESNICGMPGQFYLIYFGKSQPTQWTLELNKQSLSDGMKFTVDIIDTWNMTITPTGKTYTLKQKTPYYFHDADDVKILLPGTPYIALRITRGR